MVKDVNATPAGLLPGQFATAGGITFFSWDDGVHGMELWKVDGSPAAASLVKDVNPGSAASFYPNNYIFKGVNNKVVFTAFDGTHATLWASDGTADGTIPLSSTFPTNQLGSSVTLGGVLYVCSSGYGAPSGLWRTDGTPAGTYLLQANALSALAVYQG
jgi:ELWxxDGT repeat protein